ncbi:MAG: hypothetical protein HY321_22715 [Armatimonadetes bacterium]|nr:hypothetical protein [Armatimonadota bacterium]
MPIEFNCPACGRTLNVPDASLGATGPCPFCRARITSPGAPGEAAQLVEPPPAPLPSPGSSPGGAPGPGSPPAPPPGGPPAGAPAGPGPMVSYGPPPRYGDDRGAFGPSGVLDPGAILSEAWALVSQNATLVVGGFLLVGLIQMGVLLPIMAAFGGFSPPSGGSPPGTPNGLSPGAQGVVNLVSLALMPLTFGPLFVIDELLTRGESSFASLFLGFRRYFTILGAWLLYALATFAGLLALVVGAFFMATALSLTFGEIVDRGAGAIEALRTSWQETEGKRFMLFGNLLLLWLVGVAGVLACCVGLFITQPLMMAGYLIVYRELRGLRGITA